MRWLEAKNGEVPPHAHLGGEERNGEHVYLARAKHEGALIPGKVVEHHGGALIGWGGEEIIKYEYEVFVGGPTNWKKTSGSKIPPAAFPGGKTEDHEVLFIGRAHHDGFLTPGKVQASRECLIITWDGKEVEYKEYEILCR